jgi:DNA-binding NtrC family response regulator
MVTVQETQPESSALLGRALDAVCGAALVLDESLRVVLATQAAERLLGAHVQPGAHAVKLLCGEAVERPLAEALAAGRAVVASVPRFRVDGGDRFLRVRATPLRSRGAVSGWIVLVDEETTSAMEGPEQLHGMWTRDAQMKRLFHLAEKVAHSDVNVLIEGEMGTGKASLASAVHALSARSSAPFRAINCLGATPQLVTRHLADGGTLFFDDIAELSPDAQAELLRVLEGIAVPFDHSDRRVLDARIIAATRSSASQEVERGRLRADLMYRLRIVSLHLPPLRARHGDVALLADKFLAELNARGGRQIERIAQDALARLESHAWPGNVRELRVAIESAFATGEGRILSLCELPPEITEPFAVPEEPISARVPSVPPSDIDEATRIRRAVERSGGDRVRAATMLGMSRTTLWRRMRALGMLAAIAVLTAARF